MPNTIIKIKTGSDKDDTKKMEMSEEEHVKMSGEKPPEKQPSKEESSENDDPKKMDMTEEEHAKMEHGNAPMGMQGHDHHKLIADFRLRFLFVWGFPFR